MLVVLVHAINSNDFRVDLPRSWLGEGNFNEFGASGVDLFFVLSGFVMAHAISSASASSARRFVINRLIRIVPYYWLASIAFLATTTLTGRHYSVDALLNNLTIFPLYDPWNFVPPALLVGWSLSFELAFYVVVTMSIIASPLASVRRRLVAQSVALLSLTGLLAAPQCDLISIWANPIWFEFLLGLLVYHLWRITSPVSKLTATLLIVGGLGALSISLIFGFPFQTPHWHILNDGAGVPRSVMWAAPYAAILLGLLWFTECSPGLVKHAPWRALLKIGDASYSLYLVHLMVIFAWEDLAPTNRINSDLIILVLLAASVALAIVAFRYVERPMLHWLRSKCFSKPAEIASPAAA